jgi:DNA-binding winged helix-turn-helix (wHTH) protein
MPLLQLGLDPDDPSACTVAPACEALRPADHRVLIALASGRILSPAAAYSAAHGERLVEPGAIYSVIKRLRSTLGASHIVTVPGVGYRLHQVRLWLPAPVAIALHANANANTDPEPRRVS